MTSNPPSPRSRPSSVIGIRASSTGVTAPSTLASHMRRHATVVRCASGGARCERRAPHGPPRPPARRLRLPVPRRHRRRGARHPRAPLRLGRQGVVGATGRRHRPLRQGRDRAPSVARRGRGGHGLAGRGDDRLGGPRDGDEARRPRRLRARDDLGGSGGRAGRGGRGTRRAAVAAVPDRRGRRAARAARRAARQARPALRDAPAGRPRPGAGVARARRERRRAALHARRQLGPGDDPRLPGAAGLRGARPLAREPALGGELRPFQRAGVAYVLRARRTFLADEQGLGKTVQALAALEEDGAYPALVVCPASLKLNWEREAQHWLPHRSVAVVSGTGTVAPAADITVVNYDILHAHRARLALRRPRALVLDESHYVKNPRAKRTQAVRRLAESLAPDALRVALTGTPVMNHAEELIPQLRIIGRLEDFGSGARLARRFQGIGAEERIHWHLRRSCFVRRAKADVLPQLPAKRQVAVPVALDNERDYRLAEEDVIAWLREQPLDLRELDRMVAAALRAERLAQLNALRRLASRGKGGAALAWIDDLLASDEPLVVFAGHREVQDRLVERFPDALHMLGRDSMTAREAAVRGFQAGESQLLVCATRVAGQGITLPPASNVAFLDLEWTPAMHDQAEDRCHRIGQHDAVTAWYLLAAETIDETMVDLMARKRGIVGAVTDGTRRDAEALVEGVIRELRGSRPRRRLRSVA